MEHLLCARNRAKGMNSNDSSEKNLGGRDPYNRRGNNLPKVSQRLSDAAETMKPGGLMLSLSYILNSQASPPLIFLASFTFSPS